MRELQLWDVGDSVRETFADVEGFATRCHFTDCRHRDEPRCAVKAAVSDGRLAPDRLGSYLNLQDELAYLARQQDERGPARRQAASEGDGEGGEAAPQDEARVGARCGGL